MVSDPPFMINVGWKYIFACGSPEAVRWFLSNLPQPIDPLTIVIHERQPDGTYETRLIDYFQ